MGENILKVEGLTKVYDNFKLDHISFELESGSIVGLIGPNGAGKSTTMKLILRIMEPESGSVFFENHNIYEQKSMLYKEEIGYVGENIDYFVKCSLAEIKKFYSAFYSAWNEQYYQMLMDKLGLTESYHMSELSKGMRVKFSLCLALSHMPKMLLMDEPTSGLDPLVRNEILAVLKDYAVTYHAGILFSSHITEDMEKIADQLLFLYHGRMIEKCATRDLLDQGLEIDSYLEKLVKENR